MAFTKTTNWFAPTPLPTTNPRMIWDAVAVATSSLGYYACPEGQKGRLQGNPVYADAKWRMQAKCG